MFYWKEISFARHPVKQFPSFVCVSLVLVDQGTLVLLMYHHHPQHLCPTVTQPKLSSFCLGNGVAVPSVGAGEVQHPFGDLTGKDGSGFHGLHDHHWRVTIHFRPHTPKRTYLGFCCDQRSPKNEYIYKNSSKQVVVVEATMFAHNKRYNLYLFSHEIRGKRGICKIVQLD